MSTACSSKEPRVGSQHPQGDSKPHPLLVPMGTKHAHGWCTDIHAGNTANKVKKFKLVKSFFLKDGRCSYVVESSMHKILGSIPSSTPRNHDNKKHRNHPRILDTWFVFALVLSSYSIQSKRIYLSLPRLVTLGEKECYTESSNCLYLAHN